MGGGSGTSYGNTADSRHGGYSNKGHYSSAKYQDLDGFKPQHEDSSTLSFSNLPDNCTQAALENAIKKQCRVFDVMDPEDIHMVSVFKSAYVNFPSIEQAKKLLFNMRGKIDVEGTTVDVDFYPSSLARNRHQPPKEVNLVQDWMCDKCEFKNFARRAKCHKCDNPRNPNCKIVYNSAAIVRQGHGSAPGSNFIDTGGSANASLMIRGNVLLYCSEASVLDTFNRIAPVKDIRLVKNKHTGGMRDFAFIEFYSTEEAEKVVTHAQDNEITIDGQPVQVAFSRSRRREGEEDEEGGAEGGTSRGGPGAMPKGKAGFNPQQQQQQPLQQQDYTQAYYDPAVLANLQHYGYAAYANYAQMYQQAVPQQGQMDFNSNPFYNSMISNNLIQNTTLQAQASSNTGLKPASFNLNAIMPQTAMSTILNQAVQANTPAAQTTALPGNTMDVEKQQQITKPPELPKLEEPKIVPIPKAKTEPPQTELQKKLNEEKNKRKQIEIEMKKWEKEQQRMAMMQQFEETKKDVNGKQSEDPDALKVEQSQGSAESKPKLIICFTCRTKFPSNEALALHERLSETHRRNIEKGGQKAKVF